VLSHPQLIFPSKTWFFGIYLNFQQQKSLKNQYLPPSQCKPYQINSIKSYSSRSFQQHQRHIQFLRNVQLRFNLIFCEEIIQYSRTFAPQLQKRHGTKPIHPCWSRTFQRHQEHDLKHPALVDLITTKQNKLPSFRDR